MKGIVSDANNNTVAGASVMVEGRETVPFLTSLHGEYWKLLLPGSYSSLCVCLLYCCYQVGVLHFFFVLNKFTVWQICLA